jgi:SAM-dependent methyltransferase
VSEAAQPPPAAQTALAAYSAGEISAEIALMRLLLALGDEAALFDCLENLAVANPESPGLAGLLRAAAVNRTGVARTAALVRSGLADERTGSIAAIREQFDNAAALAPEAAVALYSLGSPETLDRATAEIAEQLRQWRLLGTSVVVLDIGCGIGRVERALSSDVRSITGIDVSPVMIAEARRRCADLANVDFAVCNGADLVAFEGQRFDLILAVDSFPYLVAADPAIAARHIAEAAELLAPNGALVILNYSYRGNLELDRAELRNFASLHGLAVERDGTRDFTLWDGATFLLRKR